MKFGTGFPIIALGSAAEVRELLAGLRAQGKTLLTVTHHLEEIPVGFTHALLLRAGRVVAGGPIDSVLTDDLVSTTFGLPLQVDRNAGRWAARAT